MRKVMYAGGLFTYDDIKDLPFPENYVQLVEIIPPDEVEARKKYLAEAIKSGEGSKGTESQGAQLPQ